MKAQITLRSGALIVVDIEELTTIMDKVGGGVAKLSWVNPEVWSAKLHTIVLPEIAAIVILDEPDGGGR